MNKIIFDELRAAAGFSNTFEEQRLEKFAELLINRAAEIANFMEDTDQTDIGDAIVEYFGLKNV